MASDKAAVHRESSSSRLGVATHDAGVHRSKRASTRDLEAAHVIDVSVPRAKERRSDSITRPKERRRVEDAVEGATTSRVRASKLLNEDDVKQHVKKMRESASKVRAAVKDGRGRSTSRSEASSSRDAVDKQVDVGQKETKKLSLVKSPTKPVEPKSSPRTKTLKAPEPTTRKAVDSSKKAVDPSKKAVDSSKKAGESPRTKTKSDGAKVEKKPLEKEARSKRTTEDLRAKRASEDKEREKGRAARHKRPTEEAGRSHRKTEVGDKLRRGDLQEESASRRQRGVSREERHLNRPQEDGDKKLRATASKEKPGNKDEHAKERSRHAGGDVGVVGEPRERNRTRVLSPSEVRLARDVAAQVAAEGARPGGDAKMADDARRSAIASTSQAFDVAVASTGEGEEDADDDYEDDFEDYESDFEQDSSEDRDQAGSDQESVVPELTTRQQPPVDEEKKLDSGNYDLAENRRSKHLHEMRAAMDRENSQLAHERRDVGVKEATTTTTLVDEGFEEEKSDEVPRGSAPRATNFINFATARKRQKEQKLTARTRRRGDALLSMITLDVISYRLFDMPPVAYDAFMSRYARAGTVQAQVQTNDDRLDEEAQTDDVCTRDAWTQRPASCGDAGTGVVKTTREQELIGAGAVLLEEDASAERRKPWRPERSVEKFLSVAAPMMTSALREGRSYRALQPNTADVGFSKGFVSLGVDSLPFLAGRPVTLVRYPSQTPGMLLSVHGASLDSPTDDDADASLRRCVVCVWSVRTPDAPLHTLASWHEVTAACFESERATLVVAGLDDGAVVVWDLRDAARHHDDADADAGAWRLRSPTYSTAEVLKDDGHLGRVVALQPLVGKDAEGIDDFAPTQVCSLEESGLVIVWTVIQSAHPGLKSGASQQDLGLAYWGRVRLVKTSSLTLHDALPTDQQLLFTDMQVNALDCHHLFASADTGHVVHALKSGAKPTPRIYQPKSDGLTFAQCIETFPFGDRLFLVGCGDGCVRLHRRESENPLTVLAGTGDAPGQGPVIRALQWSRSRPTVFFVLDDQSRVHVWDLGLSDMYPRLTATPSAAGVSAIQMAPDPLDGKTPPQLVIASSDGTVQIHELKDEYRFRSNADMTKELKNFVRFTNIL